MVIAFLLHVVVAVLFSLIVFAGYIDTDPAQLRSVSPGPGLVDDDTLNDEQPEHIESEVEIEIDDIVTDVVDTEIAIEIVQDFILEPSETDQQVPNAEPSDVVNDADLSATNFFNTIGAAGAAQGAFGSRRGMSRAGGGAQVRWQSRL